MGNLESTMRTQTESALLVGNRRQNNKPGLAEVLAMLQQFGPAAQTSQGLDTEKLSQLQQAHAYAQAHGFPSLDAMQLDQQTRHQTQIEQHQSDQEDRLDEAQQQQLGLHKDAQFLDFSKLATDPTMSQPQNKAILDQVKKRLGLPNAEATPPDPRLLKHAPTR